MDGFAIEQGRAAIEHGPRFAEHGVVNETNKRAAAVAQRDGDAEVGDTVEKIHGSIDGIDDPLPGRVLIAGVAFFSEDDVIGEDGEDVAFEESLGLAIKGEFDVVGLLFINRQIAAEGLAKRLAG